MLKNGKVFLSEIILFCVFRDRKKKKFVGQSNDEPSQKKIRTEEGTWLPASYKTGRYEQWKRDQKLGFKKDEEDGEEEQPKLKTTHRRHGTKSFKGDGTQQGKVSCAYVIKL